MSLEQHGCGIHALSAARDPPERAAEFDRIICADRRGHGKSNREKPVNIGLGDLEATQRPST
jgi:hypothetical protein